MDYGIKSQSRNQGDLQTVMVVALLGAHPSFVAQNYAGRRAVYLD